MTKLYNIALPDTMPIELRDGPSLTFVIDNLADEIVAKAAMLGLGQKVRNFAASALMDCKVAIAGNKRNDESDDAYKVRLGKVIVESDVLVKKQVELIEAGMARLYAGEWGAERTGGKAALTELRTEMAKAWIANKKMEFPKGTKTDDKYRAALDDLDSRPGTVYDKVRAFAEKIIATRAELPDFE